MKTEQFITEFQFKLNQVNKIERDAKKIRSEEIKKIIKNKIKFITIQPEEMQREIYTFNECSEDIIMYFKELLEQINKLDEMKNEHSRI